MTSPHFFSWKGKRTAVTTVGFSLAAFCAAMFAIARSQQGNERIIKISAERYEYMPAMVSLKKGEPVILELTSEDRLHGFHVPELGVRVDVLPGQPVRVRVVPDKVGKFQFTCDLFCGSGHGDMSGMISVTD